MLFASFPFLFLFLPILVWLWKLTAGEDKARLSVLLLGASLLFGACQGDVYKRQLVVPVAIAAPPWIAPVATAPAVTPVTTTVPIAATTKS